MDKLSFDGPIVLAVLDGVGLAPDSPGNAVSKARTSFLGKIAREYLHVSLDASGEAVGLLPGQMGNSEVGHNTMGAGRAYKQAIARINEAFNTGEVWNSEAWRGAITRVLSQNNREKLDNSSNVWYNEKTAPATLHFAGIFSDGGVHSHNNHLKAMMAAMFRHSLSQNISKILKNL